MKIGVYSNNVQVSTMLVSMAAQNGCKFTKIFRYSKTLLKGNDLVIIDLDNCSDGISSLEEDIPTMPEILFVGISKNDDLLDKFRGILNAEKKPFKSETFVLYKNEVSKRLESEHIINKEDNRLYDDLGISLVNDFSNANISVEKRLDILKDKIHVSKNKLEPENEFLKRTGLDKIQLEKATIVETKIIDVVEVIENDAILKYRIRKLKAMNLSNKDIDDKIVEIMNYNKTVSTSKPKINDSEKDILDKLRNGFFSDKSKSFQERKAEMQVEKINVEQKREEPVKPIIKEEVKTSINNDNNIPTKKTIEEPTRQEFPKGVNTPPLKRPLPLKEEAPEDTPINTKSSVETKTTVDVKPSIFKKPSFSLDSSDKKEEPVIGNETKKEEPQKNVFGAGIPLKKPSLSLSNNDDKDEEPSPKPLPSRKPIINLGEDEPSPKLKKPMIGINNKPFDDGDDPLTRLREQKRQQLLQNSSNQEDKTVTSNNQDEKTIKDNNGLFERKSLMESMKDRIKFGPKSQITKEEELLQRAEKKTKPPR